MNLSAVISQAAHYFGGRPAVIFEDQFITYAGLNLAVNRVTAYLQARGLNPGERAAIFMTNRPEWVAIYYGIIRAGGVAVCLSAAEKRQEIGQRLVDSGARFLITCAELAPQIPHQEKIPDTEVLSVETDPVLSRLFTKVGGFADQPKMIDRQADDPCAILYTGGTTGTPKGAALTHRNILFTSQNICYHERTHPQDKAICFMPLNHVFGGNHIMNSIFYGCGAMVLLKKFDMDEILGSISTHQITRFYSVPTVYIRLLANPDAKRLFESVTYCFSAATSMAPEIVRRWKSEFNLTIHESYGMTETASLVTFNHLYNHRIGSVGTLAGTVEARLVDPEGRPVPVGETGEIIIRGPNVMHGYFGKPEETRMALRGGWLHSGDIGRFDEDGYLYVVDRIKDIVITGGLNVYPSEVEGVLYTHPAVHECAVVGLSDEEYGEAVTALVVLKEGRETTEMELIGYCKEAIASFKAPKRVVFVAALQKSPAGKVLRREIKEKYQAKG